MTQPFQYNNFVQSQIAVGPGNMSSSYGAQPQSNNYLQTSNGNQSRLSLKQKINQLLGLCKEENQGIKNQFAQVIGAERQILDLMKEQIDQPPRFNNYARSNVEMFPGTQQAGSGAPYPPAPRYEQDQKPRSYQSFPLYKSGYQGSQILPPQNYGARNPSQQYYQSGEPAGVYKGYGSGQGQGQGQGVFPSQQYIQPGGYQGNAPQQNVRYANQDNYAPDYNASYPQGSQGQGQGNYGYDSSGHYPNDRANILKSKVNELRQQNNRLRGLTENIQAPRDQDDQTRYLQQEIARLRAVVQDYEAQYNALNNSPKADKRAYLLRQLKDQGQKIRQDTIALLRNKSSPNPGFNNNIGSYGSYGQQGPQMVSSGFRGGSQGLNPDHHAMLRDQLNQLRAQCEQLHNENANIKRMSKGTNFTSGSRRF